VKISNFCCDFPPLDSLLKNKVSASESPWSQWRFSARATGAGAGRGDTARRSPSASSIGGRNQQKFTCLSAVKKTKDEMIGKGKKMLKSPFLKELSFLIKLLKFFNFLILKIFFNFY
jgi:hypothetical protein